MGTRENERSERLQVMLSAEELKRSAFSLVHILSF